MTPDSSFWDQCAEAYAKKPVENPQAFERKIAVTLERTRPGDVVLDIGCGTGSLALKLAPRVAQVYGLDVSKEMVRIAKAKAGGVANVVFHVGTCETIDVFENESVDVVCAYSLLHLVESREVVLARIRSLLKPGGVFVSSTTCLGDSWLPYRPLLSAMRLVGKAPRVRILRRGTLEQEILRAGFVDLIAPDVGAKGTIAFLVATAPGRTVARQNPTDTL